MKQSNGGGYRKCNYKSPELLTGIAVELKTKAVRGSDKWLGESYLNVEASDGVASIRKEVVEIAA